MEDNEQELRFFNLALEDYIHILANKDIEQDEDNEDQLIYLIAVFNARLDQYVEARRLFSLLIT